MEYFMWRYDRDDSAPMYTCGMEQFEGWEFVPWNMGFPIETELPPTIRYYTDCDWEPPDYPRTGTEFHMLVSDRVSSIMQASTTGRIDRYPSEIVAPNGSIHRGFETLNMWSFLDCIDYEKSVYERRTWGGVQSNNHFQKLVLDETKIPGGVAVFRLTSVRSLLFVTEVVMRQLTDMGMTGVELLPVAEYRGIA